MTRRYALRDDQWERIKDLLPGRKETVGVTAKDNRLDSQTLKGKILSCPYEILLCCIPSNCEPLYIVPLPCGIHWKLETEKC
jgi:hypothetical protein